MSRLAHGMRRALLPALLASSALALGASQAAERVPAVAGAGSIGSAAVGGKPPAAPAVLLDMSAIRPDYGVERSSLVLAGSGKRPRPAGLPYLPGGAGGANDGRAAGPAVVAAVARSALAAGGDAGAVAQGAVGAAIDRGIDELERDLSGYGPLRNVEITYVPARDSSPRDFRADGILAFMDDGRNVIIGQVGLFKGDETSEGMNLGLGYRHLMSDDLLVGVNVFYDYLDTPTVARYSIGGEAKGEWFDFSANWYQGLSEGRAANGGLVESADGWDVEVAARMPEVPWMEFSGRYYDFDGGGATADVSGADVGVRFEPVPLVGAEVRYDVPDEGDDEVYAVVNVKYRLGVPLAEHLDPRRVATVPVKHRRYDRVRREYRQRLNRYAPPPSDDIVLTVIGTPGDATGVTLLWRWLQGTAQADVRWGQVPVTGDNYTSPSRDPVTRAGTQAFGTTTISGLIPGIQYQFNVRLFASGSATPVASSNNVRQFRVAGTAPQRPQVNVRVSPALIATGESGMVTFDVQPRPANPLTVQFGLASVGIAQGYTLAAVAGSASLVTVSSSGGSVEVPANSDSVSLSIRPSGTVDPAANGQLTISVSAGSRYDQGDQRSAVVQMAPVGTPIASVTASRSSVPEGSTVQFTVTLSTAPTSGTVDVTFAITGNGIDTSDYRLSNQDGSAFTGNTISFASGETLKSITLTALVDPDTVAENLSFDLQPGTGYLPSATRDSAAVRLSPLPLVAISAASAPIVGGGASTVTVSVDPPPTQTMVVFFSASRQDLAVGDFTLTGVSSQITVSIGAGQSSAVLTVTVPSGSRANGTLTITLGSDPSYNINSAARSSDVRIAGRPRIGVSAPPTPVPEGNDIVITFRSDPAPLTALMVPYTIGGTGGANDDFTLTNPPPGATIGNVTIPAGSDVVQVTLTAAEDDDGTERLSINLTAPTGDTPAYELNPVSSSAAVTVNPSLPVITTRTSDIAIPEGGQTTVTIRADAGLGVTTPVPVTFTITDVGGSGIDANDFSLTVGGATVTSVVGSPISVSVEGGGALDVVIAAVAGDSDTAPEMLQFAIDTAASYTVSSAAVIITINPRVDGVAGLSATPHPTNAGEVGLSWTSPGASCSMIEIAVRPAVAGGPPPRQTCTPGASQSVQARNLASGTQYTFSVTVIDASGIRSTAVEATATAP